MRALLVTLVFAAAVRAEPLLRIVAKVGNDIITSADVDQQAKVLELSMSAEERASAEGRRKLAEARARILDRMIEQKLVVLAAKDGPPGFKEAVEQGKAYNNPFLPQNSEVEEEMEKYFDQTRKQFGSQDDFEAALKAERISIPEFRNRLRETMREQMTYARMVKFKEQEFRSGLRVGEDEMRAYYEANQARFSQGEQVKLRHILFPAADLAGAKALLEELKRASDVKKAFISAARKRSADEPTRDQGGLLGWIEKGQSWPELEAAAFAAADNTLLGPIKTDAGWHLLYVEGHQKSQTKGFADVKNNVRNIIYQEKVQKRLQEWFEELKYKYYVERKEVAG
jgi:foldase protein PrsA